jgi:hypothetical protein
MAEYNRLIFFTKKQRAKPTEFTDTDAQSYKEVFAPADPASRVNAIIISSDETVINYARLQLQNTIDSSVANLGVITIPAGSGVTIGPQVVSGMNRGNLPWLTIDSDGNPFIDLNFNMVLRIAMINTIASGKKVTVAVLGGDFTE